MTQKVVDKELLKLTKRPPRTTAEKNFHEWLLQCKTLLEKGEPNDAVTLSNSRKV